MRKNIAIAATPLKNMQKYIVIAALLHHFKHVEMDLYLSATGQISGRDPLLSRMQLVTSVI